MQRGAVIRACSGKRFTLLVGALKGSGGAKAGEEGAKVDGDGVGPGELAVLVPPTLHNHRHVETQDERQGKTGKYKSILKRRHKISQNFWYNQTAVITRNWIL